MRETRYFQELLVELNTRAARAYTSLLSPSNPALREHLTRRLSAFPGRPDSFLAPPVFEARFEPKAHTETFDQLAARGFLDPALVSAMDEPPQEYREGNRLSRSWYPFSHQYESWELLERPQAHSIVVTSGTGSGKTECFLVPILNHLARQARSGASGTGVQALFLYPLNALINSQQERLSAWSRSFRGNIRYCLYNGNTPHRLPMHEIREGSQRRPEQVLDRRSLWNKPPEILVTNATMLEYMLVRPADRPILEMSQGKLRYVVLDEAHTYIGSQAAEIAMLLRRVMQGFGVDAAQVRFIATSATIGSDEARSQLEAFMADISGQPRSLVHVVKGQTRIPDIESDVDDSVEHPGFDELTRAPADVRYHALAASRAAVRIRARLAEEPCTLDELEEDSPDALRLLDLGREARPEADKYPFLPLRAHLMHRTIAGLWGCINSECPGRDEALDSSTWPFGAVFLDPRIHCPHCESLVMEIVLCRTCRTEGLLARNEERDGDLFLTAAASSMLLPGFEAEEEIENDEEAPEAEDDDSGAAPARSLDLALVMRAPTTGSASTWRIDPASGLKDGSGPKSFLVQSRDDPGWRCPHCGTPDNPSIPLVRGARVGDRFLLGIAVPGLLESMPPLAKPAEARPLDGRRLITFSDSRQGTARFAGRTHWEGERSYIRSAIYHQVLSSTRPDPARIAAAKKRVEQLEQARSQLPDPSILNGPLTDAKAELESALEPRGIPLLQVVERLAENTPVRWMFEYRSDYAPFRHRGPRLRDLAHMLVLGEFARRPTRQASLETLGLVAVRYPWIEEISVVPSSWARWGGTLVEWRDFLRILLTFHLRSYAAVMLEAGDFHWLGTGIRPHFAIRGDQAPASPRQVRWPGWWGDAAPRQRLVRLLLDAFDRLGDDRRELRAEVNDIFDDAWKAAIYSPRARERGIVITEPGARLELDAVELSLVKSAWLCPVTRSLLDTTLRGRSPFVAGSWSGGPLPMPEKITMPTPWFAFGKALDDGRTVRKEDTSAWLDSDPMVVEARKAGAWSEFSDRIADGPRYFQVAEHSGQMDASTLRRREAHFKQGKLNVLSCSTTMEMGVDIGGISGVAMNNVPPGPSNFLQRAGRAGRRKETAAVSLTICRDRPLDQAVFRNPAWAFRTAIHVPDVRMDRERIIQRHVNAFVLTRFLEQRVPADESALSLTAAWFFGSEEGESSHADRFRTWLDQQAAGEEELVRSLVALQAGTALAAQPAEDMLGRVATSIQRPQDAYAEEHENLIAELADLDEDDEDGPAARAIGNRLARLEREFLLKFLVQHQFLPAYGFPTGVVPFVTTTAEELVARKEAPPREGEPERDDNLSRFKQFPSRDVSMAIHEYAPGSEVVLDGRVYRSAGVTLNWHLPPEAGENEVREIQALKSAWRCMNCGYCETTSTRVGECPRCGSSEIRCIPVLLPAGFAVNLYERARIYTDTFTPPSVQQTWITAGGGTMMSLGSPPVARYRYSSEGTLLHLNGGPGGQGYAICLRCGRADAESHDDDAPEQDGESSVPRGMQNHWRLRGGRGDGKAQEGTGARRCEGNDSSWRIKRRQWLAGEMRTDVFELQLRHPGTGEVLDDRNAALSIAVALRQALAEKLGVEARELGYATAPRHDTTCRWTAILLFDKAAGGAGFCAEAPRLLPDLLEMARRRLTCRPEDPCDKVCPSCLLAHDTQNDEEDLDRNAGLAWLTPELISATGLAPELQVFGPGTHLEWQRPLDGIMRELDRRAPRVVRFYLHPDIADWDLGSWPGARLLVRRPDHIHAELLIPEGALGPLPWQTARTLANLTEFTGARVIEVSADHESWRGTTRRIVELDTDQGVLAFATTASDYVRPDAEWLNVPDDAMTVLGFLTGQQTPGMGRVVEPEAIRKPHPGALSQLSIVPPAHLDIRSFGRWFFQAIDLASKGLVTRMRERGPAIELSYTDRYIRSPLAALSLAAVLRESVRLGLVGPETTLSIRTSFRSGRRDPSRLTDDWVDPQALRNVLEALFAGIGGPVTLEVDTTGGKKLPHHRELTLRWEAAELVLRPDQGLGFMEPQEYARHPFHEGAGKQSERLGRLSVNLSPRSGLPVLFYTREG